MEEGTAEQLFLAPTQSPFERRIRPLEVAVRAGDAAEVAKGLDEADFAAKRSIIETLDVQTTLALEEGERVIHSLCVLGQQTLHFASESSYSGGRNAEHGFVLTARLILP